MPADGWKGSLCQKRFFFCQRPITTKNPSRWIRATLNWSYRGWSLFPRRGHGPEHKPLCGNVLQKGTTWQMKRCVLRWIDVWLKQMISLQFSNSTKWPPVAYSLCKINLRGIKNKTTIQQQRSPLLSTPTNFLSCLKADWGDFLPSVLVLLIWTWAGPLNPVH